MRILPALCAALLAASTLPATATAAAAMPATALPATAAAAVPATAWPATAAAAAARLPAAAERADIPCPKPRIAKPSAPPRPVPPPDDPAQMVVGGSALATKGLVVPAGSATPPAVTATTWMVADLDSGEVLGACGPHVRQTPASVQKTLLAATAITRLDPRQQVTVVRSDLDIEPGSSAVGLVVGGKYSISTLWLGLMLNSGNDAANALARMAGGGGADGVARTVAAMNAKAASLGAFQTHAVTPSGLDGKGQFTSAYDLALIARVCFASADFRKYVLTRSARMPAQKKPKVAGFQFQNENKLIYNYPGALGGKTGFTTVARHSYVGAAQRGGRRLVVTLLGAEARPLRGWQQGAALLDWGFRQPAGSSVGHLVTPEEVAAEPAPAATGRTTEAAAPQPASTRPAAPRGLSVAAALSVALLLAAAPLVLLFLHRRRYHAGRRAGLTPRSGRAPTPPR